MGHIHTTNTSCISKAHVSLGYLQLLSSWRCQVIICFHQQRGSTHHIPPATSLPHSEHTSSVLLTPLQASREGLPMSHIPLSDWRATIANHTCSNMPHLLTVTLTCCAAPPRFLSVHVSRADLTSSVMFACVMERICWQVMRTGGSPGAPRCSIMAAWGLKSLQPLRGSHSAVLAGIICKQ